MLYTLYTLFVFCVTDLTNHSFWTSDLSGIPVWNLGEYYFYDDSYESTKDPKRIHELNKE
jgi:hypothetical protein